MSNSTARIGPPRSARISPDRPSVGYSVIVLVVLIMTAGYVFSFFAIASAAAWTGIPDNALWIKYTAPIFIDGAIITYTTAFAVHRWRREDAHAMYARRVLYFVTGVSVLINGAHAASFWNWEFGQYEAWAGLLIAIMAPIASLFSAEQLIKLAFEQGDAAGVEAQRAVPMTSHEERGAQKVDLGSSVDEEVPGYEASPLEVITDPEEPPTPEDASAPEEPVPALSSDEPEASDSPSEYVEEISAQEWLELTAASTDALIEAPSPTLEQGDTQHPDQVLPIDHQGYFVIPGREAA